MTRKSLIISLLAMGVAAAPFAAQAETVVVDNHHPVVAHPHRHVVVVHPHHHVVVRHVVHHHVDVEKK